MENRAQFAEGLFFVFPILFGKLALQSVAEVETGAIEIGSVFPLLLIGGNPVPVPMLGEK